MTTTVHTRADRATVASSARNTQQALNLAKDRFFLRPKFNGFGLDDAHRKAACSACYEFLTSSPLIDRRKSMSGLSVQQGTETMKPITLPISGNSTGTSAHTPHSIDTAGRIDLVTTALAKAQSELKNGRYGPALGQCLKASRQMKQLCADSTVGGRHE